MTSDGIQVSSLTWRNGAMPTGGNQTSPGRLAAQITDGLAF
jgi:hypothetical protein